MPRFLCSVFSLALVFAASNVVAQNWPTWRGPHLNGVSEAKSPPTKWSKTENVLWRTELPGPAGSTPVVWGDQIFLTSVEGDQLVLVCLGTDGKMQWKKNVGAGNKDVRGDEGNSASPTPTTDGKHVWAFFANGIFVCYDIEGNEIWKFNVEDRFGKLDIAFGMTSTPILDGDRIYMQLIHGEGKPETREATVACLDAETGETIWKTGRPSDAHSECEHSYASPILYRDDQREYLVTHGADYAVAHSLDDGAEIWRIGDLNPKGNYNPTLRFVASPAGNEGLIVIPTAKNGKVVAVDPAAKGDITGNEQF
ncbi:MAG: PQQ-binding-like beta-propeller repeat protein, partial [Pirellulales bacterium]